MQEYLHQTLAEIKEAGLYKGKRLIENAQQAAITIKGEEVLNFCANGYLGLSNHPRLIETSQEMMNNREYGMSSIRFTYRTQNIHKELRAAISDYSRTEDTILYAACFDTNGGVFEPLFSEEDTIISDPLNHASIIDGVRLCKAKHYHYANVDMRDLERCLQEAQAQRFRIIVMDGILSVDGSVVPMDQVCDLAEKCDVLVMVDESHPTDVVDTTGHDASELYKTHGCVDIYTGTSGRTFGNALERFTTGYKKIIDLLRQHSRPYLFSDSLALGIIGASLEIFEMLKESNALYDKLVENVDYSRDKMTTAGFDIKPTQSTIYMVMLHDTKLSQIYTACTQKEGIYVTGFYYPVAPRDQIHICVQISTGHEKAYLDKCIAAFIKIGKELNALKVE